MTHLVWGPASVLVLILASFGSVLATTLTVVWWDGGRMRAVRRATGLTTSFLLLAVAALVLVNRQVQLFATWADVWGCC